MALGGEGSGYSPSWDVEVVPALRKRLESESKSLARRISAISLPSGDEGLPNPSLNLQAQKPLTSSLAGPSQHRRAATPNSSNPASRAKPPLSLTPRPTTGNPSRKYHRARTYSSPYVSDRDYPDTPPSLPMGADLISKQRKLSTDTNNTRPPPTRIPKAHRPPISPHTQSQPNGSTTSYPNTPNGVATNSYRHNHDNTPSSSYSHNTVTPTPDPPHRQASLDYPRSTLASASASRRGLGIGIGISPSTSGSSRSTFDLPRGNFGFSRNFTTAGSSLGLMNETPPFPTETSISSALSYSRYNYAQEGKVADEKAMAVQQHEQQRREVEEYEDPRRPSIDSEERPYEHWYRGEVSRNGGVGELKVGKRQEMLDIANYGHMIRSRDRDRRKKPQPVGYGVTYEEAYVERRGGGHQGQHPSGDWTTMTAAGRGQRKRAGSIAGLTHKERERGSLYLDDDDDDDDDVGERVMDQEPLSDLDMDMEGDEGPEEEAQKIRAAGGGGDPVRRQDHDKSRFEVDPEDAEEFVVIDSVTPGLGGVLQFPAPPTQRNVLPPIPTTTTPPPQMQQQQQQQTPNRAANRSATPTAMMANNNRSTTPTSTSTGRPSNSFPRTRIPSRKSSDSRSTVASANAAAAAAVTAANSNTAAAASGSSRSSSGGTTGTPQRSATTTATTTTTIPSSSTSSAQKRGASSPGTIVTPSKKARGTPNSAAKPKSKTPPPPSAPPSAPAPSAPAPASSPSAPAPAPAGSSSKKGKGKENRNNKEKKKLDRRDNRTSVAMYPSVDGHGDGSGSGGGGMLVDAIPSWMEPVSEGNWDDVVLPVVARKKGLDGYYENTSGSLHQLQQQQLRQKEKEKAVEPAPGTFGYDHSKYRPFTDDDDASPIDEFGVPSPTAPIPVERPPKPQGPTPPEIKELEEEEEEEEAEASGAVAVNPQLTHYVMVDMDPRPKVQMQQMEVDVEEEKAAGCCQCVVM